MIPTMKPLDLNQSGDVLLDGPAGDLEVVFDLPRGPVAGLAVVTHPHPLQGGSARHKIPQFLARALCDAGWLVARPNFRGVGRSAGPHGEGEGETDDVLALCQALRDAHPGTRLALVGFSFGAFVQARVARILADRGDAAWRVCLAGMPAGDIPGRRRYDPPEDIPDAMVIHGEQDERVPLPLVFDWARPRTQPVVVVPGADHFFSGRLPVLRSLVMAHLAG